MVVPLLEMAAAIADIYNMPLDYLTGQKKVDEDVFKRMEKISHLQKQKRQFLFY